MNIGMHCTISVKSELVFTGRIVEVTTTEDHVVVVNKLGAMYRIISVDSYQVTGEQEVTVRHLDGSETIIEVRN